jgi:hypothetical protein
VGQSVDLPRNVLGLAPVIMKSRLGRRSQSAAAGTERRKPAGGAIPPAHARTPFPATALQIPAPYPVTIGRSMPLSRALPMASG